VQGTPGAELYPRFDHSRIDHVVNVGAEPAHEGYSGFEHSDLEDFLREHEVEEITVVGLATDYCVRASALDALARGFKVTVDPAAVRGIDVKPGDSERALREIEEAGGRIDSSTAGSRA
jgi:nicotinamidase/pyrazinamidase